MRLHTLNSRYVCLKRKSINPVTEWDRSRRAFQSLEMHRHTHGPSSPSNRTYISTFFIRFLSLWFDTLPRIATADKAYVWVLESSDDYFSVTYFFQWLGAEDILRCIWLTDFAQRCQRPPGSGGSVDVRSGLSVRLFAPGVS